MEEQCKQTDRRAHCHPPVVGIPQSKQSHPPTQSVGNIEVIQETQVQLSIATLDITHSLVLRRPIPSTYNNQPVPAITVVIAAAWINMKDKYIYSHTITFSFIIHSKSHSISHWKLNNKVYTKLTIANIILILSCLCCITTKE